MKLTTSDTGAIKCTKRVQFTGSKNKKFKEELWGSLTNFLNGDFGDITPQETRINTEAYNSKYGFILGYYHTSKGTVVIALDYSKHETTVSFFGELEY